MNLAPMAMLIASLRQIRGQLPRPSQQPLVPVGAHRPELDAFSASCLRRKCSDWQSMRGDRPASPVQGAIYNRMVTLTRVNNRFSVVLRSWPGSRLTSARLTRRILMSGTGGNDPEPGSRAAKYAPLTAVLLCLAIALVALALTVFRWPAKTILVEAVMLFFLAAVGLISLALYLRSSSRAPSSPPGAAPTPGKAVPATLVIAASVPLFLSAALVSLDRVTANPGGGHAPGTAGAGTLFVGPTAGQLVYRVYGAKVREFGASWTPIDPMAIGPTEYRSVAGLPDDQNAGTHLVVGILDSPSSVLVVRPALPMRSGEPSHCFYPGGLIEYVIPHAEDHVLNVHTANLRPAFGGNLKTCPGS